MLNKFHTFIFFVGIVFSAEGVSSTPKYFDFPENGHLTPEMKQHYLEQGFILLEGYLSPASCKKLSEEGQRLVSEFNVSSEDLTIFSTTDEGNVLKKDAYFIDSADKIRPFFEASAIKDGKVQVPMEQAVNKLAHALGEINPVFKEVTFNKSVVSLAHGLGLADPCLSQSMLIMKSARTGGSVIAHQDASFINTNPLTAIGFWMPLVDATTENACLSVIPGSHRWPLLTHYVKNPDASGFIFIDPENDTPLSLRDLGERANKHWPKEMYVPVEMKAGSLLLFHGLLVHQSAANTSDKNRPAYTFHVIDGESTWDPRNWLQRKVFHSLDEK